jgi:tRNA pseudouridine38-40 synthase
LSAEWQNRGDEWTFSIQADAFLYHMVRRLVYVQVAVGQGRLPVETLVQALEKEPASVRELRKEAQNRIPAGLAPASGLTLVEVCYDNLV